MGEVLTAVNNIREVFKDLRDALENKGYHVSPFAPKYWADIISAKGELTEEHEDEINRLANNGEVLEGARWSENNSLFEYLYNNRIYPTSLNISGCSDFDSVRITLCNYSGDENKQMLKNTSSIFLSNMNSDITRNGTGLLHDASLKKVVAVDSESCETISSNTVEEMEYRNVKKTYFYDMDYTELKKLTLDIENNTCEDGYNRPNDITIDCDSSGSPKLEEFTLGDKYTGKLYMDYDKELGIPLEKVTIPNTLEKDSSLIISQGGTIKINGVSESDWGPYTIESAMSNVSQRDDAAYHAGWAKLFEFDDIVGHSRYDGVLEQQIVTCSSGAITKKISIDGVLGTESSCVLYDSIPRKFEYSLSVENKGNMYYLHKKEVVYCWDLFQRDSNSQKFKTGCKNGVNYTVSNDTNYIWCTESTTKETIEEAAPNEPCMWLYNKPVAVGSNNTILSVLWCHLHPEANFRNEYSEEYGGNSYTYSLKVEVGANLGHKLILTTEKKKKVAI